MPGRSSNTANPNDLYKFTGHERDTESGLDIDFMNARTYDSEIGRFLQMDPLAHLFQGVSPYVYALNNPLIYIDPDGRFSTHVDSSGMVIAVYEDEDHGVYIHSGSEEEIQAKTEACQTTGDTSCGGTHLGKTEFWDEFKFGDILNLNYGPIDEWVAKLQYMYLKMPTGEGKEAVRMALAALLSLSGQPLDIKESLPGGYRAGFQYDGYWMTAQSAGNRLAGKNAAIVGVSWTATIAAAGALHVRDNRSVGSLRYLGETNYAGRQIRSGYKSIRR